MLKENKESFFHLEFIDLLAYYIPGLISIISFIIWCKIFNIDLINIVNPKDFSDKQINYIQGMTWTLLSVIVPYITGHLIFPLSLSVGNLFGKVPLPKDIEKKCEFTRDNNSYCQLEDYAFAKCLSKCLVVENLSYFNLWLSRFRTFNRFYRAIIFPLIILSITFFVFSCTLFHHDSPMKFPIIGLVISFLIMASVFGISSRSKKYEMRWRNGICAVNK